MKENKEIKNSALTVEDFASKYGIIGDGIKNISIKDGKGFYKGKPIEEWKKEMDDLYSKDGREF